MRRLRTALAVGASCLALAWGGGALAQALVLGGSASGGGGGSPAGPTNALQTNGGGGAFGSITPGTGVATALAITAIGPSAGGIVLGLDPGVGNSFIGALAGNNTTTGSYNAAQGYSALQNNTTGNYNAAQGGSALYANTTGSNNAAQGSSALYNNTTGNFNAAQGEGALYTNTTGGYNDAQGGLALYDNTTGGFNAAQGSSALYYNTTGGYNAAQGYFALYGNTTQVASLGSITGGSGYANGTYSSVQASLSSGSSAFTYPTVNVTVSGGAVTGVTLVTYGSGFKDTTTVLTVAASLIGGTGSGFTVPVASLTVGQYNTAVGARAGYNSSVALQTGTYDTYLGYGANAYADGYTNSTALGNGAQVTQSNQVQLGNSSVTLVSAAGAYRHQTVYSAAGTAVPACTSGLNGTEYLVSDATSPTNGGTYTSGGSVWAHVVCNGSSTTNITVF